jgi:hypothetical protein
MRKITNSSFQYAMAAGWRPVSALRGKACTTAKTGAGASQRGVGNPSLHAVRLENLGILVVAVILVISLTGCESSGVAVPQFPPPIDLPDLHGNRVTLAQYRGVSPVLLVFYRGRW